MIIIIKLYDPLNIMPNLDSILPLDIVLLSMGRKYIGHLNEFLGIIGETPFPIPHGRVEDLIVSYIGEKGEFSYYLIIFIGSHVYYPVSHTP